MVFKDDIIKFRISSDLKSKLSEYAKKNKTTITRILETKIIEIIKKDSKNDKPL